MLYNLTEKWLPERRDRFQNWLRDVPEEKERWIKREATGRDPEFVIFKSQTWGEEGLRIGETITLHKADGLLVGIEGLKWFVRQCNKK